MTPKTRRHLYELGSNVHAWSESTTQPGPEILTGTAERLEGPGAGTEEVARILWKGTGRRTFEVFLSLRGPITLRIGEPSGSVYTVIPRRDAIDPIRAGVGWLESDLSISDWMR